MQRTEKIIRKIIIWLIVVYQKTLSPDHSFWRYIIGKRICRFHPTCSDYAIESIEKYGVIKGIPMALRRIGRCHPFNPGGYDPVQ